MSSNFAEVYKLKSGNIDRTSVRVRRKSSEWKNNRIEGVNKLRHIDKLSPLQELDRNTPNKVEYEGETPHKKNGKSSDTKKGSRVNDRRDQLAKWLQQKELKKKLEANEKCKKQPFKIVHNKHQDADLYKKDVKSIKKKDIKVETKNPARVGEAKKTQGAACTSTNVQSTALNSQEHKLESKNSKVTETRRTRATASTGTKLESKNDGRQKEKTGMRSLKTAPTGSKLASPRGRVTRQSSRQAGLASSNKKQPDSRTKAAPVKSESKVSGKPNTRSTRKDKKEQITDNDLDPVKINTDRGTSFAPADFTFEAPSNLTSFVFKPLSPTSADYFLFPTTDNIQPSMLQTPVTDSERNYRFSTPKSVKKGKKVEHSPPNKIDEILTGDAQANSMDEGSQQQNKENNIPKPDVTMKNQQSESDTETSSQGSSSHCPTNDNIKNTPRRSTRIRKSQIFPSEDKHSDSGVVFENEDSKVTKMECDTTVDDTAVNNVVHSPMSRSARKSLLQKKEISTDGSKVEPESTTSDIEMNENELLLTGIPNDSSGMVETVSDNVFSDEAVDCSEESKSTCAETYNSVEKTKDNEKTVMNSMSLISVGESAENIKPVNATTGNSDASVSETVTPSRTRKTRKTISAVDEFVKPSPDMAPSSQKRSAKKRRRTEASSTPSLVRSPEEWVKVLENSPMIEMGRRTPKMKTPPERTVPPLDLDDIDVFELDDKVFQPLPPINFNVTDTSNVIENKENVCPAVSSTSDIEKPMETEECRNNNSENEKLQEPAQQIEGEHNVAFFRNKLSSETTRLNNLGEKWNNIMESTVDLSEDHKGQIRTTIGQSQLLMNQRFKQFTGLVDNCEFKTGEKETTCTDLQGFWDMVYYQVEDVDKKFLVLDKLNANNWKEETVQPVKKTASKVQKKKMPAKSKPAGKSKFSAFRAQMKKQQEEKIVFDAGFFKVSSPAKSPTFQCEGGTPKKNVEDSNRSPNFKLDPVVTTTPKLSNEGTSSRTEPVSEREKEEIYQPPRTSLSSRRSYIPSVPSPLLKDITPKVEPRRRSSRCTPHSKRQILTSIDDSLCEMNDIMNDLSGKALPKTPVISTTPRRLSLRRSIQKRKSVSFMDTKESTESETKENEEPESGGLTKYLQPTPVVQPPSSRPRRSSIAFEEPDGDKENDDIFSKYLQPSVSDTDYESSKPRKSSCLKILPSDERRKSRRSVHFQSSPTVDNPYRTRHASTPYNRSSLVPQRRVDRRSSSSDSPKKATPVKSSGSDLMSFSPW